MPRNASVGPLWLLSPLVVDDVEDHLDAGVVEALHHRLELAHGSPVALKRMSGARKAIVL